MRIRGSTRAQALIKLFLRRNSAGRDLREPRPSSHVSKASARLQNHTWTGEAEIKDVGRELPFLM